MCGLARIYGSPLVCIIVRRVWNAPRSGVVVTQNQTHLPVTFAFAQKRIHLLLAYVLRTFEENATPLQCIVMTVGIVVYLFPVPLCRCWGT